MPVAPLPCPLCAGMIQVDSDWAGRQVACPLCRGAFVVPGQAGGSGTNACGAVSPPPPPRSMESGDNAADLLPPGAAVQQAEAASAGLEMLLPPGVDAMLPAEATAPRGDGVWEPSTPPSILFEADEVAAPRRKPMARVPSSRLTPKDRAQRRLLKNVIVFGVCIVALVVVFYLLAR